MVVVHLEEYWGSKFYGLINLELSSNLEVSGLLFAPFFCMYNRANSGHGFRGVLALSINRFLGLFYVFSSFLASTIAFLNTMMSSSYFDLAFLHMLQRCGNVLSFSGRLGFWGCVKELFWPLLSWSLPSLKISSQVMLGYLTTAGSFYGFVIVFPCLASIHPIRVL